MDVDLELPTDVLHGLILYAETHYTFRYFGSLLKRREPEVLADAPWRIEPNVPIPVLCLIKDANLFPVHLAAISVRVLYPSGRLDEHAFSFRTSMAEPLWHTILHFVPHEQGVVFVDVAFRIRTKRKERVIHNDNYRTASHAPLRIRVSSEPLPRDAGWYYGEPHFHTTYSNDQVEFGAPLGAAVSLAKAMGLHWLAATDHSYDLDDLQDNPLESDPALGLWHQMRAEVLEANRTHRDFVALAGEEISCGNDKGRNIHLLALGTDRFVEGAGDSAERWLRTRPEWTAAEAIEKVNLGGGIAYAAHPAERTPFFQWLLIRRGRWSASDLAHPVLRGVQIWNGERTHGLRNGRSQWVRLLLDGHRKHILGGNDAHGNFNRFRQIGIPFVAMRESDRQLFGRVRTGVFVGGDLTDQAVLDALRNGRSIVTDGPFLGIGFRDEADCATAIGRTSRGPAFDLRIQGRTSDEFGAWEELVLYHGNLGRREETTPVRLGGADLKRTFVREVSVAGTGPGYIRAEARTTKGHLCMTNPVWIAQ
jgi:hypothetical protein